MDEEWLTTSAINASILRRATSGTSPPTEILPPSPPITVAGTSTTDHIGGMILAFPFHKNAALLAPAINALSLYYHKNSISSVPPQWRPWVTQLVALQEKDIHAIQDTAQAAITITSPILQPPLASAWDMAVHELHTVICEAVKTGTQTCADAETQARRVLYDLRNIVCRRWVSYHGMCEEARAAQQAAEASAKSVLENETAHILHKIQSGVRDIYDTLRDSLQVLQSAGLVIDMKSPVSYPQALVPNVNGLHQAKHVLGSWLRMVLQMQDTASRDEYAPVSAHQVLQQIQTMIKSMYRQLEGAIFQWKTHEAAIQATHAEEAATANVNMCGERQRIITHTQEVQCGAWEQIARAYVQCNESVQRLRIPLDTLLRIETYQGVGSESAQAVLHTLQRDLPVYKSSCERKIWTTLCLFAMKASAYLVSTPVPPQSV